MYLSVHHAISSLTTGPNLTKTCYMTSPLGKGVPEQHYFSLLSVGEQWLGFTEVLLAGKCFVLISAQKHCGYSLELPHQ